MLGNWVEETTSTLVAADVGAVISLGGAATADVMPFSAKYSSGDLVPVVLKQGNNRQLCTGTLASGAPWTFTVSKIIEKWDGAVHTASPATGISLTGTATISVDMADGLVLPARTKATNLNSSTPYIVDAFIPYGASGSTTRSTSAGQLWIMPFYLHAPVVLSGLGCNIVTAATTGTVLQFGRYRLNELDNSLTLIDQTATTSALTTGYHDASFASNITLSAGLHIVGMDGDCNAVVSGFSSLYTLGHPFFPQVYDGRVDAAYRIAAYTPGTMPVAVTALGHNDALNGNNVLPVIHGVLA